MKIRFWWINKTGVLLAIASLLPVSITSCNIFGALDNPLDPGAESYQGFTTVTKSSDIRPESPEDGGRLNDGFLTISGVIGATAYEIRIAETAEELDTSPVFHKADFASNILDLRGSSLDALRPYFWKARAYRDGGWDTEWSSVAEFVPWYPYTWSHPATFPYSACSLDGIVRYKFSGGGVEVSVDSGQTWDLRLSGITAYSTDIAANSNGNTAVTILYKDGNSRMYKSSDTGQTWVECLSAGVRNWKSVTMDLSGNIILAADYEGFLYISKNSGLTWEPQASPGERTWQSVEASNDGRILVATDEVGKLFVSKNYGNDWNRCEPVTDDVYWGEANSRCNSEGSHIVHIRGLDYAYQSYDYGKTWKRITAPGARYWYTVAMNSDGSIIALGCLLADDKKSLWLSIDSGRTWNFVSLAEPGYEACIAVYLFDSGRAIIANMNSETWEGTMLSW